jgi:hypothetical protein
VLSIYRHGHRLWSFSHLCYALLFVWSVFRTTLLGLYLAKRQVAENLALVPYVTFSPVYDDVCSVAVRSLTSTNKCACSWMVRSSLHAALVAPLSAGARVGLKNDVILLRR